MSNVPANALSLETILKLRNNILAHSPESTSVLASLEQRSVSLLYQFGKHKDQVILTRN